MTQQEAFGGDWTRDKLERLSDYLRAYMQILRRYPGYATVYVDAFAGTGVIPPKASLPYNPASGLETAEPSDVAAFLTGSARVALSVEPAFGSYLFVERVAKKARELEELRGAFPDRADRIEIANADANEYLTRWAAKTDWRRTRAVVFLDPCGMQVEWRLLEALGRTRAVDLWLLVPIGMGVNRLLTSSELPPKEWQERLTRFFGTDDWINACYREPLQKSFLTEEPRVEKAVNYDGLAQYFTDRLKTIFPQVAPVPLTQRNSRNSPMFMLTFAATNATALKIADYLLRRPRR